MCSLHCILLRSRCLDYVSKTIFIFVCFIVILVPSCSIVFLRVRSQSSAGEPYSLNLLFSSLWVLSHSPLCRLIVIAEKDVVYNNFPIPLINRLEKHFLVTLTSLTPDQKDLVQKMGTWASEFAEVSGEGRRGRWCYKKRVSRLLLWGHLMLLNFVMFGILRDFGCALCSWLKKKLLASSKCWISPKRHNLKYK